VFYRIISQRLYNMKPVFEGLEGEGSCKNDYGNIDNLPLKEYIIKACYNSAYDPNQIDTISAINLETRIAEGYRFIDLNVFSSDGKLYVGYSPDNKPTLTSTSIPFTTALDCIKKHSFVKSTMRLDDDKTPLLEPKKESVGPTLRDTYVNYPIFVFIRVYRSETSKMDIIEKVAELLKSTSDTKYHREGDTDGEKAIQIDGCTNLSSIKGKMLFVMDIVNILQIYTPTDKPSADQIPENTRKILTKFVNIYTGGNVWRHGLINRPMPIRISELTDPYKTNLFHMQIAFPSLKETTNPDTHNLIVEHSIQTIVIRPYLADTNLQSYTKIFKELKTPMVCGAYVYNYIKKLEK